MVFNIPSSLTPLSALNCARFIENAQSDNTFYYDFQSMQNCPAFGMLIISNAIRRNMSKYRHSKHIPINCQFNQGSNYAADLGFFQSIGWPIGRETSCSDHGIRHIPIKKITIRDLQDIYLEKTIILGEMVDTYARELALMLTQDNTCVATDVLQYCIREMIRNTFEHSHAEEVWVCGQYWPQRSKAEIAILDEGCGIRASLIQNSRFKCSTDAEANKLALQPGISRTYGQKSDPFDVWGNSGYGLFMASSICAMDGAFWLCSGKNATLITNATQNQYDIDLNGTAICMRMKTDQIENIDNSLKEISTKGEEIAKENGGRILTASKVSTIASIIKTISKSSDKS